MRCITNGFCSYQTKYNTKKKKNIINWLQVLLKTNYKTEKLYVLKKTSVGFFQWFFSVLNRTGCITNCNKLIEFQRCKRYPRNCKSTTAAKPSCVGISHNDTVHNLSPFLIKCAKRIIICVKMKTTNEQLPELLWLCKTIQKTKQKNNI